MIPKAEARLAAKGAAAKCDAAYRVDAFAAAYSTLLRRSVGKTWESDKHRQCWAAKTARGAVLDLGREMHWSPGAMERVMMPLQVADESAANPAEEAEEADDTEATRAEIEAEIAALPAEDRGIARERLLEQRTLKDIGERRGVSESRICQRMKLIRARIMAGVSNACVARGMPDRNIAAAKAAARRLTKRRREVLAWLAAGKTQSEIAVILNIGLPAVHNQVTAICSALGVSSGWAAALVWLQTPEEAEEEALNPTL